MTEQTYPPCKICRSETNERKPNAKNRSGWHSYCKPCANQKSREWNKSNAERVRETNAEWRKQNPERIKQTRSKHVEKERESARKWRKDNIERARENDAAWRKNNPEKARLKDQQRRANKVNATHGDPITKDNIDAIYQYQNGKCFYCLCEIDLSYHMDHFMPIALGGAHSSSNIVLACAKCNLTKGAKDPVNFMESKGLEIIKTTEAREQARLVAWTHKKAVRELMPELRWLYHAANGEKRDKFTAGKLKAMGVVPGVPDLTLPVKRPTFTGLIIEMKSATGSLSSEQKEWRDHYLSQGWEFYICRSAEEGRFALCEYLGVLPENVPELP
jgi:hypothetical protein